MWKKAREGIGGTLKEAEKNGGIDGNVDKRKDRTRPKHSLGIRGNSRISSKSMEKLWSPVSIMETRWEEKSRLVGGGGGWGGRKASTLTPAHITTLSFAL